MQAEDALQKIRKTVKFGGEGSSLKGADGSRLQGRAEQRRLLVAHAHAHTRTHGTDHMKVAFAHTK